MTQLLGPAEIRALAAQLDIRPTKKLGQNFVHDANTVRRIVQLADVNTDDVVLEVGPGLGSLTLGLLDVCRQVIAVEIDPILAQQLPATAQTHAPGETDRLTVIHHDALQLDPSTMDEAPTALVANLPYNVAVPVVLHILAEFPSITRVLVMVQTEVADRMAAGPGSRTYGVPSVKLAWYGTARKAASVSRTVFWPVPNVDSSLVSFNRHKNPLADDVDRRELFRVIDAAFSQRRKTLRTALASWAGSPAAAEQILRAAQVDPRLRGEQLTINDFVRIVQALRYG